MTSAASTVASVLSLKAVRCRLPLLLGGMFLFQGFRNGSSR